MIADQYFHILDENQLTYAQLVERAFYGGKGAEPGLGMGEKVVAAIEQIIDSGIDPIQLIKAPPEMMKILQMRSKNMSA